MEREYGYAYIVYDFFDQLFITIREPSEGFLRRKKIKSKKWPEKNPNEEVHAFIGDAA